MGATHRGSSSKPFARTAMSEFLDNLREVFALFGPIHARRMFGGHGVFHDGLMFGLVADDVLYLKADAASAETFAQRGLEPFRYAKKSRVVALSYYAAPEEIFDNPEEARVWATLAFEAALRSRKPRRQTITADR